MEAAAIADGIIALVKAEFQTTNPELLSKCMLFLLNNDANDNPEFNKKFPGIISNAFGFNKQLDITTRLIGNVKEWDTQHEDWEATINSFGALNPKMDAAISKLRTDLLAALK